MQILLIVCVACVATACIGFWLWVLVDCLTTESREGNDRLVWTLVNILTKFVGAANYYFLRHRKRAPLAVA